jgi:hypothetical protein
VGKPEGKKPLGNIKTMSVDNIKMDLGGIGRGDVDFIGLVQDTYNCRALFNSAKNLRVS